MFPGINSSPLLAHRGYLTVDYPGRMPMPHAVYGQRESGSPLHAQHFNVRGRRLLDDPTVYRSPLLEEFRSDRVRNWELKVRAYSVSAPSLLFANLFFVDPM